MRGGSLTCYRAMLSVFTALAFEELWMAIAFCLQVGGTCERLRQQDEVFSF